MSESKNLWGGRFKGKADPGFTEFNNSFRFDRRLFEADVVASIAWCRALECAGVLTAEEANKITQALESVRAEGASVESAAEDVHSFVEARLVGMIGDVGRKLHTGRSRNDQVATDLRLWLRESLDDLSGVVQDVQSSLLDFAETNREVV